MRPDGQGTTRLISSRSVRLGPLSKVHIHTSPRCVPLLLRAAPSDRVRIPRHLITSRLLAATCPSGGLSHRPPAVQPRLSLSPRLERSPHSLMHGPRSLLLAPSRSLPNHVVLRYHGKSECKAEACVTTSQTALRVSDGPSLPTVAHLCSHTAPAPAAGLSRSQFQTCRYSTPNSFTSRVTLAWVCFLSKPSLKPSATPPRFSLLAHAELKLLLSLRPERAAVAWAGEAAAVSQPASLRHSLLSTQQSFRAFFRV